MEWLKNDKNIKIIGAIHLGCATILSNYGTLIKKNSFDMIYIFLMINILLSWTCLNGECPVTLFLKKQKDNEYICGKNSGDLTDLSLFIPSKTILFIFLLLINVFYVMSEFIILKRNNYSKYIYYTLPLLHILYILSVASISNLYKNENFLLIQECLKFGFVILFVAIFSRFLINECDS
jgi:hypothetical protein